MNEAPTHLETIDAVIDALGGPGAVRDLTASSPPMLSNWRAAGFFPRDLFFVMTSSLNAAGYTADPRLWRQRVPDQPERAAS